MLVPVLDKNFAPRGRYVLWLMIMAGLVMPLFSFVPSPMFQVEMPFSPALAQPGQLYSPRSVIVNRSASEPTIYYASGNETQGPTVNHMPGGNIPAIEANADIGLSASQAEYTVASSWLPNITAWYIILVIWLSGLVLSAGYHMLNHISFKRFVRRWQMPETNPQVLRLIDIIKDNMAICTHVSFARCKGINSPVLIGLANPTILLPESEYDIEDLHFMIRHELIHLIRRDLLYKLLLVAVKCIYWFNPAIHLMAQQANKDIEIICDGLTVNNMDTESKQRYSEIILSMACAPRRYSSYLTTNFNGNKKMLKYRFGNILGKAKKGGAMMFMIIGGLIFTSGLMVGINFAGIPLETSAAEIPIYTPAPPILPIPSPFPTMLPPSTIPPPLTSPLPFPAISPTPLMPTPFPAMPPFWPFNNHNWPSSTERLADIRYNDDLNQLHAMVYDEPRLIEHIFDYVNSLNIILVSDSVNITTGGDQLVIRFYEWMEGQFAVDSTQGNINLAWSPPYYKMHLNAPNRASMTMSGFSLDDYFYDRNWLIRYLEAAGRPTTTAIEIIVPESMPLNAVSIITVNGDIFLNGLFVGSDANLSTVSGRINVIGSIFSSTTNLSGVGSEITIAGSIFNSVANLSNIGSEINVTESIFWSRAYLSTISGSVYSTNNYFDSTANISAAYINVGYCVFYQLNLTAIHGSTRIVLAEGIDLYDIRVANVLGEIRHNGNLIARDSLRNPNGVMRIYLSGVGGNINIYDS